MVNCSHFIWSILVVLYGQLDSLSRENWYSQKVSSIVIVCGKLSSWPTFENFNCGWRSCHFGRNSEMSTRSSIYHILCAKLSSGRTFENFHLWLTWLCFILVEILKSPLAAPFTTYLYYGTDFWEFLPVVDVVAPHSERYSSGPRSVCHDSFICVIHACVCHDSIYVWCVCVCDMTPHWGIFVWPKVCIPWLIHMCNTCVCVTWPHSEE